MIAISISVLFVPLIWELINDRNGDSFKREDVFIRILLAMTAAIVGWYLIHKPIPDGIFLSLAIHWMLFDYAIAYILIKKGIIEPRDGVTLKWFTYLGRTAVTDKVKLWREMKPWTRFFVRLGVLITAIIIYVI